MTERKTEHQEKEDYLKEKLIEIINKIEIYTENNFKLINDHKKNINNILSNENIDYKNLKTAQERLKYFVNLEEQIVQENICFYNNINLSRDKFHKNLDIFRNQIEDAKKTFDLKINRIDYGEGLLNNFKSFSNKILNNRIGKFYNSDYILLNNNLDILNKQLNQDNIKKTDFEKELLKYYSVIESLNNQKELDFRIDDINCANQINGKIVNPKSQLYKDINIVNFIDHTNLCYEFINDNLSPESFNKLITGISKDCEKMLDDFGKDITSHKDTLVKKITEIKKGKEIFKTFSSKDDVFQNETNYYKFNKKLLKASSCPTLSKKITSVGNYFKDFKDLNVEKFYSGVFNLALKSIILVGSYKCPTLIMEPIHLVQNIDNIKPSEENISKYSGLALDKGTDMILNYIHDVKMPSREETKKIVSDYKNFYNSNNLYNLNNIKNQKMVVTEIKNTDKPFPIEIPFNINLFAFKKENFEPENSKESLLKLIIEDYTKNKLITMEKPSIKKSELNIPITL